MLHLLPALFLGAAAAAATPALEEGIRLFEARRFDAAKVEFEKAAQTDPADPQAPYYLGRLALQANDWDASIDWLQKAVKLEDGSSLYHHWLGRAYGQKARRANVFSQAMLAGNVREHFERAVELDATYLEARSDLISFYLEAPRLMGGSEEKALAQAGEILKRDAGRGHLAMARIHEHGKRMDEAEKAHLAAVQANQEEPNPRLLLGFFYQRGERWDDAVRVFEAVAASEKGRLAGLYQIGRSGALSGRHLERAAEALAAYLKEPVAEGQPPLSAAHFRLAQVHEKSKRVDLARSEYEAVLRLEPSHKEAREALAKLAPPRPGTGR